MSQETIELPVTEIVMGDRVDLKSCPYLSDHPSAEFEFAEVVFTQRETANCIVIGYDGIDHVGYPIEQKLKIRKRNLDEQFEQRMLARTSQIEGRWFEAGFLIYLADEGETESTVLVPVLGDRQIVTRLNNDLIMPLCGDRRAFPEDTLP